MSSLLQKPAGNEHKATYQIGLEKVKFIVLSHTKKNCSSDIFIYKFLIFGALEGCLTNKVGGIDLIPTVRVLNVILTVEFFAPTFGN